MRRARYLAGSAWKEYRERGLVGGELMPPGLKESQRLDPPVFTPATKAESGHDENIPFEQLAGAIGSDLAHTVRAMSLAAYMEARVQAERRGLILADTKFEFGMLPEPGGGRDSSSSTKSSRPIVLATGLPRDRAGRPQPSFDKQYVRDWLEATGWDKASPPPRLPDEVVARTREKYVEAFETHHRSAFPLEVTCSAT